jgi:tRNA(fMet)-specific endonuclease VapC
MIAFDADVFTDILTGDQRLAVRANQVPAHEQAVPIVVIEEIIRGRLNSIRQAEAGKIKLTVARSYTLFDETLKAFRPILTLPYTDAAEELYRRWRHEKRRGGTHDMRIAAICVSQSAKLITRNRRDFDQFPGLFLEVWE